MGDWAFGRRPLEMNWAVFLAAAFPTPRQKGYLHSGVRVEGDVWFVGSLWLAIVIVICS